jgi:hypothetical protein
VQFDVVWLNYSFSQANIEFKSLGTLSRVNLDDHKSTMEELRNARQPISELWDRQPSESLLHVIVEIPAEGGPPTGTSTWNIFGLIFE